MLLVVDIDRTTTCVSRTEKTNRRNELMADTDESKAKVGTINLKYNEVIEETDSDLTNKTTKTVKQVSIKDMSEFEFQKEMKMLLQIYDLDVTFKLKPIPDFEDDDDEEEQ